MILAAAAFAAACAGPAPVALRGDPARIDAGVERLFDPARSYTLEQVSAPPLCAQFQALRGTPEFGFEARGVWLRLNLPALAAPAEHWRLLAPYTGTDRLCVHWPLRAGGHESRCADAADAQGAYGRSEPGWYFVVPAALDPARPVLLYTQGERMVEVPLEIGTADGFVRQQHIRQTGYGALYGLLLAAMALGLALFVALRDRTYLHFALFLFGLSAFVALRENHLSAWGLSGGWAVRWVQPMGGLVMAAGTAFFQRFLETETHTPRLHRLMFAAMALALIPHLAYPLLPAAVAPALLSVTGIAWQLTVIATALRRITQGFRHAAYVVFSLASLGIGGLLRALAALGVPVLDLLTAKLFLDVGLIVGAGVLATGLVARVRQLALERDRAHELALSSQRLSLHRAQHDDLTQLPNRTRLCSALQERLLHAAPGAGRWAVVTVGLDRIRAVSRALGKTGADAALLELAQRLRKQLGPDQLLARVAPEAFAWATPLAAGDGAARELEQRCAALGRALGQPLTQAQGAALGACFGLALHPEHAHSAEQLLQCSDTALSRAAERGEPLAWFDPSQQQTAAQFLELSRDLRQALDGGELELHYQPIMSLSRGRLLGVEGLLRWHRADGTYVPPDRAIPVAEATELIEPLTAWVIDTACGQLADWRRRGRPVPYVAINVSARQFRLAAFAERVDAGLARHGLPGACLVLEITESVLLDNLAVTREVLARLRHLGVGIAVDDFGVRYSSLGYLRTLPVNFIKIDRSFVNGVPAEPESVAVIGAIITLGRDLGYQVVAEGIETRAQQDFLLHRGVEMGQGFWYSRALPAVALERWLLEPERRWAAA